MSDPTAAQNALDIFRGEWTSSLPPTDGDALRAGAMAIVARKYTG